MWNNQKVSVVYSTYNEKNSIRSYTADLFKTGVVDEVIAVNNNAVKGTDEEILKTKAKLVHESKHIMACLSGQAIYTQDGKKYTLAQALVRTRVSMNLTIRSIAYM